MNRVSDLAYKITDLRKLIEKITSENRGLTENEFKRTICDALEINPADTEKVENGIRQYREIIKTNKLTDREFLEYLIGELYYQIAELNTVLDNDDDKYKGRSAVNSLDLYSMVIISKYFNSVQDFINAEKTNSKYRGLIEKVQQNPFPLQTIKEYEIFQNLNTYVLYSDKPREEISEFLNLLKKLEGKAPKKIKAVQTMESNDFKLLNNYNVYDKDVKSDITDKKIKVLKYSYLVDEIGKDGKKRKVNKENEIEIERLDHDLKNIREEAKIDPLASVLSDTKFNKEEVDLGGTQIRKFKCENALGTFDESYTNFKPRRNGIKRYRLRRIVLPKTLEVMEKYSFRKCTGLSEIYYRTSDDQKIEGLPPYLEEIGDYCFEGCNKLSRIVIRNAQNIKIRMDAFSYLLLKSVEIKRNQFGSTENHGVLEDSCFCQCTMLKNIIMDEGIVKLDDFCFKGCIALTEIELPKSIEHMGCRTFEGCYNLKEIVIPNNVTHIGSYCFCGCKRLSYVRLPNELEKIKWMCFAGCGLKSVEIPKSVTELQAECFRMCTELTSIKLPSTLKSIGYNCFMDCASLSEINLNECQIKRLYKKTFYRCTNLQYIDLPTTLTRIDNKCIYRCNQLIKVTIPSNVVYISKYNFDNTMTLIEIDENNPQYEVKNQKIVEKEIDLSAEDFNLSEERNENEIENENENVSENESEEEHSVIDVDELIDDVIDIIDVDEEDEGE